MTEEKFAKDQIRRLSGLDGFPKDTKAIHELVFALMVCTTDAQASRVVDDILGQSQFGSKCPYPADVRRLSYERVENEKAKVAPMPVRRAHCPRCHDHGFFGGYFPGGEKEASPWQWCSCAAAQEKRSREPSFIDDANARRERLIKLFSVTEPVSAIVDELAKRKRLANVEPYHGEF